MDNREHVNGVAEENVAAEITAGELQRALAQHGESPTPEAVAVLARPVGPPSPDSKPTIELSRDQRNEVRSGILRRALETMLAAPAQTEATTLTKVMNATSGLLLTEQLQIFLACRDLAHGVEDKTVRENFIGQIGLAVAHAKVKLFEGGNMGLADAEQAIADVEDAGEKAALYLQLTKRL